MDNTSDSESQNPILQEIWQTELTWDEPLPETINDEWIAVLSDLQELPQLLTPRPYFPHGQTGTKFDNIFVFADASTKAYEAVVYLNSNDHVSFVQDSCSPS